MRKIKVFLGGYVNYSNAQNLNCSAIAKNLDKDKFKIYTLEVYFGKGHSVSYNTFFCFWPFRLTRHLGYLWGLIHSDVLYLPKNLDTPIWLLKLANFLKKPIFTTIEGKVIDINEPDHNLINLFGSLERMRSHFVYFNAIYAITGNIIQSSNQTIKMQDNPLFLGVDFEDYSNCIKKGLSSIIFVGSLTKRKRVDEFIKLASFFPMLDFKIVGDGVEKERFKSLATNNITFLGALEHTKINDVFLKSDLMFLPAKSEGFPKVILEAAASGTPCVVYNTYGANEWITNNLDGFVVSNFEEVKDIIVRLIDEPQRLETISSNSVILASKYDWKVLIKDWEKVIEHLFDEHY